MKPTFTRWLLLLMLAVLPAGAAFAQGVTTAALTGVVTDQNGETLPGANVVALHEPTGTQYGTTTNANGRYNLLSLRAGGPYTVTVSFVGYNTARETELNLTLGQTRQLDFQLAEATAQLGEVEVVGVASTVLNSERTGASTNIDQQTIERLPTISRSLSDFARLTPQSTGGSSLAGRNNRYNNIQIDGATLNDVFGLSGSGAPGGQAGAQPISLDAIQEFNVDIAPYDVRYNGFTGGSINAITKSGTNQFTGSLRYLGRNESFVGSLPNADGTKSEFGEFSEQYFVGNVGGPIQKNKLFFFFNAEYEKETSPLDAGIQGSGAANVFPVDAAAFNRIIDIARNKYGYDPGGYDPLSDGRDNIKLLGKLDWNINQNNRLTLRHNYVDAADDAGISRSTSNYDFGNRRYIFKSVTNSTVAELRTTLGANMFNQGRLVYTRIRDERDVQADPFPFVQIQVGSRERVYLGIDRFSQANALDQDIFEFTNDFTYITGRHNVTVGTSNQFYKFSNLFIQDYYGAYEFNSIDDFEAGRPSRYYYSYSRLPGVETPRAEFNAFQLGLYAQDQYQVNPSLTVTLGLRVDAPFFPDEPVDNPDVPAVFPEYSTTTTASGNLLFSPRLGFNWDASGGARTTQVRGGTGIFSGRTPFVWVSNQYSNTGADIGRVDKRNPGAGCFIASADPSAQPRPGTQLGTQCGLAAITTAEVNLISEDFKFPQVWRTNLAVDQQLPLGVIATLEGIYSKAINDVVYRNLNIEQTGTAVGGRPVYGTASSNGTTNIVDPRFTSVLLLENTNEGYEYSLTGQLRKQSRMGLDGSFSYTFNRAENVNNGTSSRAISNWQFNEAVDINNPDLATSDFEVRHRILGNLSYRVDYANRFATTFGLFYEGRSGSPFSWIYSGNANADTRRDNDPVYVPASQNDIVLTSNNWDALNAFIESEPSLRDARGSIVKRNAARAPWQNRLDLNLTQQVKTISGQRVEFTANLLNVLNLINDEWGVIYFTSNDNYQLLNFSGYDASGKPIVSYTPLSDSNGDGEVDRLDLFQRASLASRWQLQLGVRYVF